MKEINWGIISTGNIANSFARDFRYAKNGRLAAVASRSIIKAIEFAKKYQIPKSYGSYEELFEDPDIDVVYIGTPHNFHFDNAQEAIKRKKAVLCEKPITTNPKDCEKLIDLSTKQRVFLMEGMWTYFLPPIRKSIEWINEGRIGKVKYLRSEFGFKATYDPEHRLFNPKLAGGALLDIGIYPIALAWMVFGDFPESIRVTAKMCKTGVDVEETMIFKYPNGAVANLSASLGYDMPNEAVIIGEHGYIKIPEFFMTKECFLYRENSMMEHFVDDRTATGYNYQIDAVNDCLKRNKLESEIMSLENSRKFQEIIEMVNSKF